MKTKNEYIESLASELKEYSAKIDLLVANSESATAEIKLRYIEDINALRIKELAAIEKMKELKEAGGDAWETIKETADKVWDDLRVGPGRCRFQIQVRSCR